MINADRLLRDLAELSAIGGRPDGGVDRVAWSAAELQARAWLRSRIEDFGWYAWSDAALNVFGSASNTRRRRLLIGSHTDSVPAGGRLDGAYGVVAALEVARALAEARDPAAEHVELVDFADEEGVRFPCGYFGSKALVGVLALDLQGVAAILEGAGVDVANVASAQRHLEDVAGYLELHIEQGPRLEHEGLSVAVVPGILGFDRYAIAIEGRSAHGGTTPLELRNDPLQVASTFIAGVPETVRAGDGSATATVGNISSTGGAINFVPETVSFTLEVRDRSTGGLKRLVDTLRSRLQALAAEHGCKVSFERHELVAESKGGVGLAVEPAYSAPVEFDPRLVDAVERGCVEAGVSYRRMHAGTWHDAGVLAGSRPSAMLLVRSRGGITHSPTEATSEEDLVAGARALEQATRHAVSTLDLA